MAKRRSYRIKKTIGPKLPKVSKTNPVHPPLIIRNLPGALNLEDTIRLNSPIPEPIPADIEEAIDSFAVPLFGIKFAHVQFRWPEDYDASSAQFSSDKTYLRKIRTENQFSAFERKFKTSAMDDIAATKHFLSLGIDFTDQQHRPLLSTRFLCRQLEAVIRGYAGRLPDRNALDVDRWARDLEEEVATFASKKRKGVRS